MRAELVFTTAILSRGHLASDHGRRMKERVSVDRAYVADNDADRERPRSLVTGLSDEDPFDDGAVIPLARIGKARPERYIVATI